MIRRRLLQFVVCSLALLAAGCAGGGVASGPDPDQNSARPEEITEPQDQSPSPPDQAYSPPVPGILGPGRNTLMVAMSDGTRLATDVYLPAGAGPWPVMLVRTPYNKDGEEAYATEVGAEGIAYVAQDMRGRWASEGWNVPLIGEDLGEHQDGLDTYAWIERQPWCNGRIASLGGSALGMTQLYSAPCQPPGLVCQFIGVAPASMYHEFIYLGGAFREEILDWVEINRFDQQTTELYFQHSTYNEFWQQFNMADSVADVQAPGMHYGGWFDTFSQGTINTYMLRQHQGDDGARGRQWLVMGPWVHGETGSPVCGEIEFPEIARHVPDMAYVSFMDYFLKDIENGFDQRSAVTYYVIGDVDDDSAPGNEWRYAEDWPVPATETTYYLQANGSLSLDQPSAEQTSNWTFNPLNPPPTLGGRNLMIAKGVCDQRPVEARGDVVVFETEPLAAPLEVTGRVTCRLWVSCDAVDTDVAVRLCDVYPDGRSLLMLDGIQRLRYRDSMEQTELLTPGRVYEVEVDLWSISIIFNTAHRIRLSVAGGNNPRWDVNPGTGEMWQDGGQYVVQHTTLYHNSTRPSALVLPVVE